MEIPHEHLQVLATRIEDSTRREVDRVRDELCTRISEVKDDIGDVKQNVRSLNGRVRKSEIAVAVLKWAVGGAGIVSMALLVEFLRRVWP